MGMWPSNECFHPGDFTGGEQDLGLVVREQGGAPDGGDQVQFDIGSNVVMAAHLCGVDADAVAAEGLGMQHGMFGLAHQFGHGDYAGL